MLINVGILVSYDYIFLKDSLPLIYKESDRIILALDKNYNTWSGNRFIVEQSFFDWIIEFDKDKKIEFYREDFYVSTLTSMQNETRERTMLAECFEKGSWYIQLDSDELFINFEGYTKALKDNSSYLKNPKKNQVQICLFFVNLFKKVDGGYLYVSKPFEPFSTATNFINYKVARVTYGQKKYLPFFVVHNTWARENEEIYFKLNNWGHNKDFDVEKYFSLWKNVTKDNFNELKNFHPVEGKKWQELSFCPGENLKDVVTYFQKNQILKISKLFLWGKNIAQQFKHFKI